MKVILIGASGLIGSLLLKKLLADPAYISIRSIGRRPLGIQHPKLEQVLIDFEDGALFRQAVTFADALFCCVGTTQKKVKGDKNTYRKVDFEIPAKAAKFCAEQGIPQFLLVSSVGANESSNRFYLALKGETETAVLKQAIPTVYIMRPSMLLGNRKESRPGEIIGKGVMQLVSLFLFGGGSKYKAIQAADVAEALLRASKQTVKGKYICEYNEITQLAAGKK